jgi:hypothetical protein
MLIAEFERFYHAEEMAGEIDDNGKAKSMYRLHWAGDVPSMSYAIALVDAMKHMNGKVDFWNYTRSFPFVPKLLEASNCMLYISADAVNLEEATKVYNEHRDKDNIAWCYMSKEDPDDGSVSCPVDTGKLELEGACHRCRLCLKGERIWFKIK